MLARHAINAGRLLALALGLAPTAALAGGTSDSFSISVTLPPIAAALQAQAQGAVGLSTLDQPGGGLMVRAPDALAQGTPGTLDVFTLKGAVVSVRVADGGPSGAPSALASVTPVATTPLNGMDRNTFSIAPASGALDPQDPNANVVSLVVSSL
jgi:hypothetical protein